MKIYGLILLSIVILSGIIWYKTSENSISNTSTTYNLEKSKADLGNMNVKDERSVDFIITNTGNENLIIKNTATSCNCTSAIVKTKTNTSPEINMSMHMDNVARNWQGQIAPNDSATITAIYRPSLMPVAGAVERYITFETNGTPQKNSLTIKANVAL